MATMGISELKLCNHCGESKPLDGFHKLARNPDGYHYSCKVCRRAEMKVRYEADPEPAKQRSRDRYEADPGKQKAYEARRRAAKHDQIKRKHKEWRDANREHLRAYKAANYSTEADMRYKRTRRAKKAAAVPQRWKKSEHDAGLCYWCGVDLESVIREVDHIMPIALKGPATESNEVPSCLACNHAKWKKHPLVWIAEMFP